MINESIRLVSPVQWAMRQAVRDTELLGYYLPKGTNVIAYPGMNHRLEEIYPDPYKFDPDRFTEPRNEHKKHRYGFTPFGGGAHKCIGMVFGQLEIKTIMHRLLRRYRLELPRPGYPAALRLRRHAGAHGRHADRVAALDADFGPAGRARYRRAGGDANRGRGFGLAESTSHREVVRHVGRQR